VRSEPLASSAATAPDARAAGRVHANLTALPGLLAEADLSVAQVEARDRRTGGLIAYSFVTIHRALALHVAEAVRAGLARLDIEAAGQGSGPDEPGASGRAPSPVQDESQPPGQYL
jgi:hypothetical protein